jgi:hypothetical protein
MPMAERVYGDATASEQERAAAVLARWIIAAQPAALHVRGCQDCARPNPRGCLGAGRGGLVREPAPGAAFGQRGRNRVTVNPRLWEVRQ